MTVRDLISSRNTADGDAARVSTAIHGAADIDASDDVIISKRLHQLTPPLTAIRSRVI
jgi:hypothetical protein